MPPQVTITRRLHFSAAHRVHNPAMSDEQNRRIFGKCNNPNWHGHNYILDVSVTGAVDEQTGYVVALTSVREVLGRAPDVLVNNAAQFFVAPVERTSVRDFDRTLVVNLVSQFAF